MTVNEHQQKVSYVQQRVLLSRNISNVRCVCMIKLLTEMDDSSSSENTTISGCIVWKSTAVVLQIYCLWTVAIQLVITKQLHLSQVY
jgi:hypothetical protein